MLQIYPRKSVASDQRVFMSRRPVEFSVGLMAKAFSDYVFSLETLYMVDRIFYRSRVAFSEKKEKSWWSVILTCCCFVWGGAAGPPKEKLGFFAFTHIYTNTLTITRFTRIHFLQH